MKKMLIKIIIAGLFMGLVTAAGAEVCNGISGKPLFIPFPGSLRITPAFPDRASRYDNLSFSQHTGDYEVLKITGEFPHARYFSINLYDFEAAAPVAAIADYEIKPDMGHVNPYIPGNYRHSDKRSYTLYVVKAGADLPFSGNENLVVIPPDIDNVSLVVRVYRPDNGQNDKGGVALPVVEALKSNGSPGRCPNIGMDPGLVRDKIPLLVFAKDLIQTWDVGKAYLGDRLDGFRISDSGLFPNAHNRYIVTPLARYSFNNVAVVTFKPPTHEDTFHGADTLTGDRAVRYWSFCVGGLAITATVDCITDDEVRYNPDGTVTVVIGNLSVKRMTEQAGLNYLRWGFTYMPLLIHRHMLAAENFPEQIGNLPSLPRPIPLDITDAELDYHSASKWMGPYAPTGKIYSRREFRRWLKTL